MGYRRCYHDETPDADWHKIHQLNMMSAAFKPRCNLTVITFVARRLMESQDGVAVNTRRYECVDKCDIDSRFRICSAASVSKTRHPLVTIISSNRNRFSQSFHCWSGTPVVKFPTKQCVLPTTYNTCCCTTSRKLNLQI